MVHVEDQDRLLVAADLRPGELLDQFLQRPDPARKRDEGVRTLEHDALSLMHVAGDDPLLRALQHEFGADQKIRHHAGHGSTAVKR